MKKTKTTITTVTPVEKELLVTQHPTTKSKWINNIAFFAMGLIAVGLAFMLYWAVSGKDVLEIKNEPLPVKPSFVKREEFVTVSVDFCKKVKAEGTLYTRFVSDKTELIAPTVQENLGTGCHNNFAFRVPIPPQLTPGKYHLNYRVDYKPNPLTNVREEFNTQDFEVIE